MSLTVSILGRVRLKQPINYRVGKANYEIQVFGSTCYVFRYREHLGKFDGKSDEAILLAYSTTRRVYHVYNIRARTMEESINVAVNDFEETYEQENLPAVLSDHENEISSHLEIKKS